MSYTIAIAEYFTTDPAPFFDPVEQAMRNAHRRFVGACLAPIAGPPFSYLRPAVLHREEVNQALQRLKKPPTGRSAGAPVPARETAKTELNERRKAAEPSHCARLRANGARQP